HLPTNSQTHEFLIACGLWLKVGKKYEADIQADIQAEEQQISGGKIPGVCWACKWAMKKLKKHLGTKENDAIKAKLLKVCSGIGLLKKRCENFINKNIDVLTEELSTSDDPKTICTNIGDQPQHWSDLTLSCHKREQHDGPFLSATLEHSTPPKPHPPQYILDLTH
uniref:Saposin B-type domain-containing protein n=1 Tax=Astyanax mexicanus TaxID=7994 RepID=A0A3B1JR09_ASTMX